jgi:hypothetical protein
MNCLIKKVNPSRPIQEDVGENTVLVDYSSDEHTSDRHMLMAEVDEVGSQYNDKLHDQVFGDGNTAEAGNEDEAQRATRRMKNQRHAQRRRNAPEPQQLVVATWMLSSQRLVKEGSVPHCQYCH